MQGKEHWASRAILSGTTRQWMEVVFVYLASIVIPAPQGQRGGLSACSKGLTDLTTDKSLLLFKGGYFPGKFTSVLKERKHLGCSKEDKTTATSESNL